MKTENHFRNIIYAFSNSKCTSGRNVAPHGAHREVAIRAGPTGVAARVDKGHQGVG